MDLENSAAEAAVTADSGRRGSSSRGGSAPTLAPTLAQAIEEGVSGREAKRMALELSKALAERHSRGLVHGELTPRCVLLERKGGLAIEPAADPGPALYRLRYAAPETARREDPTSAADVFALSLIIRELIEGLPARRSQGEELAHEAIDGRVSVPHGLERELHGLAALAASPHPENRPAASEFVAALKGSTQKRGFSGLEWVIAGLAIAAVLMLGLMLRSTAQENERSIRQVSGSRKAAETLFSGTYSSIDRIRDLAPLEDAGTRALAALDDARAGSRPSEADDILYAKALAWNGAINERLGKDRVATEQLRAVLDIEQVLPEGSIDAEIQLKTRAALARLAENRGEPEVREQRLAEVLQRGRPLVRADGPDPTFRLIVATALMDLAELAGSSGREGESQVFESLEEARSLLADTTDDAELERRRSELRARLAGALATQCEARGEAAEAMAHIGERAEFTKSLLALAPGDPKAMEAAAEASVDFADAHRRLGSYPDAVAQFREAVESWTRLVEMEPRRAPWRLARARARRHLAYCLDRVGDAQGAARVREPAIAELRALIDEGTPGSHRTDLTKLLVESSEGYLAAGELELARRTLNDARDALEVRADYPELWRGVASTRISACLAEIFLAKGQFEKAESSALDVISTYQAYAAKGQGQEFQRERVRALFVTAAVKISRGEVEEGMRVRNSALGIAQSMRGDPELAVEAQSLEARALFLLSRDAECREVLQALDERGYRGLELNAARTGALGR